MTMISKDYYDRLARQAHSYHLMAELWALRERSDLAANWVMAEKQARLQLKEEAARLLAMAERLKLTRAQNACRQRAQEMLP